MLISKSFLTKLQIVKMMHVTQTLHLEQVMHLGDMSLFQGISPKSMKYEHQNIYSTFALQTFRQ